ncbi:TetR/AcrR family transcriptional regulator [Streptomyces sp. B1866]|uniref:TetR/AcrR family transcriptional regulator n=1 Tax=Streptomyces sp. B1866 TaxID=3075431 RepID=UPI002891193E|nr:TetR/AcrR family transcriptional regulator [Streptomyces sp. B1866]MDT3400137.1 TetR/AcrR family transcriptional regulator [Streptomyces sp. B1866]
MGSSRRAGRPSARERLLAAADELFYAEGVQSVGIDRVIEHAGVAKASLYNTFGGKEQLIRAYLEARHARASEHVRHVMECCRTPRERILAIFEAQGEVFASPDFHGCAFVSAAAEARPGGLVEQAADDHRRALRAVFTELAEQAGAADPARLAHQLHLLYDGAVLSARHDRCPTAAEAARAAAAALLDAAAGPAREGPG